MSTEPTPQAEPHRETRVRELHSSEFWKLQYLPMFQDGVPALGHTRVIVLETPGEDRDADWLIVGYWFLFDAVHIEPLWIAPEFRKNPGSGRKLWRKVFDVLKSLPIGAAWACIQHTDQEANEEMALRLGFAKLPASVYVLKLPREES